MKIKPRPEYQYLRDMATLEDRTWFYRIRRKCGATLLVLLLAILALSAGALYMDHIVANSEGQTRMMARALQRSGGCMFRDQPTALFVVGNNEDVVSGALLSITAQVADLMQAQRTARGIAPLPPLRFPEKDTKKY